MKNFLRIVMFLIIVAAVAGTTIFLTDQNNNYTTNELDKVSSGDIENIDDTLNISGEDSGEIFSGEILDSGEKIEIDGDESGERVEISGDEIEILPEMTSGEKLDEISGEISGDAGNEINEEEQVA